MSVRERPLSPHVMHYRWQIGNTLSILHRFTGIALALGIVALAYWLIAIAGGEDSYETARQLFAGPLGRLFLIGWTFSFLYHLFNGVRHLFWDAGYGFERTQRHASGWIVVLAAVALTLGIWAAVWHGAQS